MLLKNDEKVKWSFTCEYCDFVFTRKNQLKQHLSHYEKSIYGCSGCNQKLFQKRNLKAYIHSNIPEPVQISTQNPYYEIVKCF